MGTSVRCVLSDVESIRGQSTMGYYSEMRGEDGCASLMLGLENVYSPLVVQQAGLAGAEECAQWCGCRGEA